MKRLKLLSVCVAMVGMLTGCLQNHGYIGRLFGSWTLYEMTVDGQEYDISQHGDLFWSFQSNLITITLVFDHGTVGKGVGTWIETDETLILNLNYKYDNGTGHYEPLSWLGIPDSDNVVLNYIVKERNKMSFSYTSPDGTSYYYSLKRTH